MLAAGMLIGPWGLKLIDDVEAILHISEFGVILMLFIVGLLLFALRRRALSARIAELERRGHQLDRWPDWHELAGHAHGIVIDPDSGMRYGGSDPRSDGAAIGY